VEHRFYLNALKRVNIIFGFFNHEWTPIDTNHWIFPVLLARMTKPRKPEGQGADYLLLGLVEFWGAPRKLSG
jgi:hypothetical protein